MPAKNFLAGPSLKAQGQRNGFDVSYQNQFTAPFGMLLPCFFQRVNPDDKLDICLESQTVCDGLVRPAFMRLKEHYDYYFIPTTQLWMPFDNLVTGQNSYFSTAVADKNSKKVPEQVPCFTTGLIADLIPEWSSRRDERGYRFLEGAKRLLDLLGYYNLSTVNNTDLVNMFENTSEKHNLFPLLCYQKVYYDFYRNPKYEDNKVSAYNIDDIAANTVLDDLGELGTRFNHFFEIHYRWQKKDYFTQLQPSVLVTTQDFGYDGLNSAIPAIGSLLNVPGLPYSGQTRVQLTSATNAGGNAGTSVIAAANSTVTQNPNVTAIRFAFAYDRLLRRMRQAGPDFDSQMLAQYGVRPFDARHGKCTYLGGYTNNLTTKDVTNMTGEDIGELAGQINVYSDNTKRHLHYHAKEHGYVIGIYSTSIENMYQSYRTSRETMLLSRFDWFNPAFESLGLQPVFASEYDYTDDQSGVPSDRARTFRPASRTEIMGYVPRYSELKTRVDECHGLLCMFSNVVGFKEWNVQINQFLGRQAGVPLTKFSMQLDPAQFDNVSGLEYDGTQYKDHFIINTYTHSRKVSSMSVYEEF